VSEREPLDGSFFGLEFSLPVYGEALIIFLGGCYSFWVAYRAVQTGVHEWETNRTSRAENPKFFAFHVSLSVFLGIVAVVGAVLMAFDLGVKP
jgi:hypothetical protein